MRRGAVLPDALVALDGSCAVASAVQLGTGRPDCVVTNEAKQNTANM